MQQKQQQKEKSILSPFLTKEVSAVNEQKYKDSQPNSAAIKNEIQITYICIFIESIGIIRI
ncbi:hypothetical protein F050043D4_24790 [Bacteroides thetaiotaomicron]